MNSHSVQIGKLFGIPVHAHASWLPLFVLVTGTLAVAHFPAQYPHWPQAVYYQLALATSLLLFVSLLVHELAHSLVARHHGLGVEAIVLFLLGGVSEISQEPPTPASEWAIALSGPLASIALGLITGLLWVLPWPGGHGQPLPAMLGYLCGINLSLGVFNLLPGYPLDGGRVLRATLWRFSHSLEWATRWAVRVARLVALAFVALGIWQALTASILNGLWLAVIGCFLDVAAHSSYRQVLMQARLAGHTVGEIMTSDYAARSPDISLQQVADEGLLESGCQCLLLVENGTLSGLLTPRRLQAQPRHRWPQQTARQAMIPAAELAVTQPSQALLQALNTLPADESLPLAVLEDGCLVGVLTAERISAFLEFKATLARGEGHAA